MSEPGRRLFSEGRIGPLTLKNRVIMAPMTTRKADADGFVTEAGIAYYVARARGGVGLITVEMAAPEPAGKHRNFELGLSDDRFLPGLTRLVEAIHRAGAKAAIQIGHGGGHTRIDIAGETPIAPS
ncbi:MAG: NADPH dehydrogenase, partial [Bosea sp. (in: a-proteobacteria)]